MTIEEFNEKYKDYLEDRYYGLAINDEHVIAYLDDLFEKDLIKREGFKYHQIKLKFGTARFYADEVTADESYKIEEVINTILKAEEPTFVTIRNEDLKVVIDSFSKEEEE
jgi:hypothetical protein